MTVVPFFRDKEVLLKESHMRNLVLMANADNTISRSELQVIFSIAKERGVSEEKIADIINIPSKPQFAIPESNYGKFEHLFDLTRVMLADGVIEDDEWALCIDIAVQFGFGNDISAILMAKITREILREKNCQQVYQACLKVINDAH